MPIGSSDPRFAGVATDPRFRRPKQKNVKVEIDERFRQVLESDEFGGQGIETGKKGKRLDKYGRPLATSHHQDQLKHFYRFKSPEAGEPASKDRKAAKEQASSTFVDFARGEGQLESSGSEDETDEEDADSADEDDGEIEVGMGKKRMRIPGRDLDTEDEEGDEDQEGDDLDINLSEDEDDAAAAQAIVSAAKKASAVKGKEKQHRDISSFPTEEEIQQADAEAAELEQADLIEPTKRIAIVNLDWDNMRAIDLYTVFHSILNSYRPDARASRGSADPRTERKKAVVPRGKLLSVRVFPSEFGKERMAREEQEGPAAEVFGTRFVESRNGKGGSRSRARDVSEEVSIDDITDEDDLTDGALDDLSDAEADEDPVDDEDAQDDEAASQDEDEEDDEGDDPVGLDMGGDGDSETSDIPEGDVDMDKLRAYQLERLRYYYAIATFSDVSASEYIMEECNGTEFERTANVLDMMYVPDETEFDLDEFRDEATEEVKGYKGNDFVTDALRHSKVKLTWDQDDPNRVKVLRRAMTKQEIEEDDFKAYLASGTDDDASDLEEGDSIGRKTKTVKAKDNKPKLQGKALRDLLLNGGDDEADVWGKHGGTGNPFGALEAEDLGGEGGEMEITFKSGLTIKGDATSDGDLDETTIERYRRRMKEKVNRKKEKKELKAGTRAAKDAEASDGKHVPRRADEEDEFFNDDNIDGADEFLQSEVEPFRGKKASAKPTKLDKRSDKPKAADDTQPGRLAAPREDLDALAGIDEAKHFSMQDIIKAEKDAGKKKRKRNKKSNAVEKDVELGDEGFDINVQDDRFKVLHEEPAFAIDPSNPHFVKTKGMSKLLQEGTKRRQQQAAITAAQALQQTQSKQKTAPVGAHSAVGLPQVVAATSTVGSTSASGSGDQSLLDLVANVKRKLGDETATGDTSGSKKKRRRR